jgi:hypothetical protein
MYVAEVEGLAKAEAGNSRDATGQRRILAPARTNRDGFDRLDDGESRCGGRADQGAVRGATPIQQNVQHAFWSVR